MHANESMVGAEGLLVAALLAPLLAPAGPPFGRSAPLRGAVEPDLFVCRGFEGNRRISGGRKGFVGPIDGRGRGIRTPDPLLPKQMRYQTAPCPVPCRRLGRGRHPNHFSADKQLRCQYESTTGIHTRAINRRPPNGTRGVGRKTRRLGSSAAPCSSAVRFVVEQHSCADQ
jgi:hypothetical protein